jgi:hypothetical protein
VFDLCVFDPALIGKAKLARDRGRSRRA